MYKVIQALPGYGYEIGTITSHINPADVEFFLNEGKIILIKEEAPEKPKKKSGK